MCLQLMQSPTRRRWVAEFSLGAIRIQNTRTFTNECCLSGVITTEEDQLSERKRIVHRDLSIYLNWLTVQYVWSILPLPYGIHRSHVFPLHRFLQLPPSARPHPECQHCEQHRDILGAISPLSEMT